MAMLGRKCCFVKESQHASSCLNLTRNQVFWIRATTVLGKRHSGGSSEYLHPSCLSFIRVFGKYWEPTMCMNCARQWWQSEELGSLLSKVYNLIKRSLSMTNLICPPSMQDCRRFLWQRLLVVPQHLFSSSRVIQVLAEKLTTNQTTALPSLSCS